MKKTFLKTGDIAYTTGAFIEWDNESKKWTVTQFEDDTFFDGECVENVEENPYTEGDGEEEE